jgi:hypothetical protein
MRVNIILFNLLIFHSANSLNSLNSLNMLTRFVIDDGHVDSGERTQDTRSLYSYYASMYCMCSVSPAQFF